MKIPRKSILTFSAFLLLILGFKVMEVLRTHEVKTQSETESQRSIESGTESGAEIQSRESLATGLKANLSDPDSLEDSFLAVSRSFEEKSTVEPELLKKAAEHLIGALAWRENPSRKLLMIEMESILWSYLRVAGSRQAAVHELARDPLRRELFLAFRTSAEDEIERLSLENPGSALVLFIKEI